MSEIKPNSAYEWTKKATLQELVDQCIWESVITGTAYCGWTDNARDNLVKLVQENVRWAIAQKTAQPEANEGD